SGASDAHATYAWGWDATFLYLAIRVTDDVHVPGPRGETMYRGDIVELQFDANLAGDFTQAFMSADDSQFGLSPGDFASQPPEAYRWYPTQYAAAAASVWVRATKTGEGYTLEASLPWAVLGATPAAGSRFGFALSLSDNDAQGAAAQQSLVSSVTTRTLLDPTSWGTLILQ
ncbi:MAG: sugar-binding protein, partial [Anaerolineales bacterium]